MSTPRQRAVLRDVYADHRRGLWYRARSHGERVTLASLHRAGALTRRAWRGTDGSANAAYEYSPSAEFISALNN